MRYMKKVFWPIIVALDWLIGALSTAGRPQTRDAANAQYFEGLDAMGNRIGSNVGGNAKPGERLPPR
ncbi:MAG TPA: hypothetical protein VI759_02820 [Dehalococcoidia bacterium]|nr:hypothetical protein [Dehalococcoidia bacterium]